MLTIGGVDDRRPCMVNVLAGDDDRSRLLDDEGLLSTSCCFSLEMLGMGVGDDPVSGEASRC